MSETIFLCKGLQDPPNNNSKCRMPRTESLFDNSILQPKYCIHVPKYIYIYIYIHTGSRWNQFQGKGSNTFPLTSLTFVRETGLSSFCCRMPAHQSCIKSICREGTLTHIQLITTRSCNVASIQCYTYMYSEVDNTKRMRNRCRLIQSFRKINPQHYLLYVTCLHRFRLKSSVSALLADWVT